MKHWYEDGKQLKAERKRLGLTQAKLAKLAGVTQALISAVEHGVKEMATEDTRRKIANELVQMRHNRIVEMGATPNDQIKALRAALAHSQAMEQRGIEMIEKQDRTIAELMDILGLREKKILTEESEQQKIDALGLEKIPPVEEQEMHAEIEQRGKKGSK